MEGDFVMRGMPQCVTCVDDMDRYTYRNDIHALILCEGFSVTPR